MTDNSSQINQSNLMQQNFQTIAAQNESMAVKSTQNGMNFLVSSFVASTIANVTGIVTGHPLDTVKIRM